MGFYKNMAIAIGGLLFVMSVGPVFGEMALNRAIIDFVPGSSNREDVEIQNTGTDPLYVNVSVFEVMSPGLSAETRVELNDPNQLDLLVSPRKMVIQPGAIRLMRVVNLTPPGERERIYRVNVTPAVGELTREQAGLKLIVGYELLVIVRPTNPKPLLDVNRRDNVLSVRNRGNSNVLFFNGELCSPAGTCVPLPTKRIYAGASWTLTLTASGEVRYYQQTMGLTNTLVTY
ncbi:MAG: fimbria/pilus periplasmic chaperone [Pseudomonadota bacterium]|nr:fimbria/pilus periplasmic chaperone [Pseudomonadota bacterium]